MRNRRGLVAALVLTALASPALAADQASQQATTYRLEGAWDLVLTFSDGSQVNSVLNVAAGPDANSGSVIHASALSFAPPNPTLPEQGSWRRTGARRFVASYYGYSYDLSFNPFGRIGFKHAITLGQNGATFTGTAVFEVYEGDVLVFSDQVQTSGVRQVAVGP
jgi:hypothetical protein